MRKRSDNGYGTAENDAALAVFPHDESPRRSNGLRLHHLAEFKRRPGKAGATKFEAHQDMLRE